MRINDIGPTQRGSHSHGGVVNAWAYTFSRFKGWMHKRICIVCAFIKESVMFIILLYVRI